MICSRAARFVLAVALIGSATMIGRAQAPEASPAAAAQPAADAATDVAPDAAQSGAAQSGAAKVRLRARIEDTWRVVPLTDGLLLVPRRAAIRAKGVELGASGIALDGRPATGNELVERLGADAESVLQLSYLSAAERVALFADPPETPVERPRVARPPNVAQRAEPEAWPVHRGARVRIFGPITIKEGEQVGDVVAVFGSIDLQGSASGDVVAVFGNVVLGPRSLTRGNVVAVAGAVRPMDASRVLGKLTEFRIDLPTFHLTVPGDDQVSIHVTPDWPRIARYQWIVALVTALLVLSICVFAVLVAPNAVEAVREPRRSIVLCALVGLATQILSLPALALIASALTLSVIGIPLLALIPVLLLALMAATIVGFTGVAARIGSVPLRGHRAGVSVLAVVFGLAVIWAPGLVGRYLWAESGGYSPWGIGLSVFGAAVEYAFWTIGLGGAVLAGMAGMARRRRVAAPVPAAPPIPVC